MLVSNGFHPTTGDVMHHRLLFGAIVGCLLLTACNPIEAGRRLVDDDPPAQTATPSSTDGTAVGAESPIAEATAEPDVTGEAGAPTATPPSPEITDGEVEPSPAEQNERFSDLRVCTVEMFDEERNRCNENQAADMPTTSAVYCSALVAGGEGGGRLTAELQVDGVVVRDFDARIGAGQTYPTWFGFELGDNPLPGGQWECVWSVDGAQDRISQPFPLSGERGPLAGATACSAADTLDDGMCEPDAPDAVDETDEIVCSATFVGFDDAMFEVALYEGGQLLQAIENSTGDSALTTYWASFPGSGEGWPASSYRCLWTVEGDALGEASLEIG
ncbi:hypothetical protein BH20ACT8_BH20ACT8_07700 [soil metagenome]